MNVVSTIEIDMRDTDIKTAIRQMIARSGVRSLASVARGMEINETTLRVAVNNGQIRLKDFLRIAELCGFQVVVRSGDSPKLESENVDA